MGVEELLKQNGVEIVVLNNSECRKLFKKYVEENPNDWANELSKVGNSTEI